MRKTIQELIKILKNIVIDLHNGHVNNHEIEKKIAGLVIAVEKFLEDYDRTLDEKIDFLIFMASKRVDMKDGRTMVFEGEQLYKEWKAARDKMLAERGQSDTSSYNTFGQTPIPNEEPPHDPK